MCTTMAVAEIVTGNGVSKISAPFKAFRGDTGALRDSTLRMRLFREFGRRDGVGEWHRKAGEIKEVGGRS